MPHRDKLYGAYALLGGSFDPIHNGHLYLAKEVLSLTPVEKVILVPSFHHNFKSRSILLDYEQRLSLTRDAVNHFSLTNFVCQPAEDFCTPIEVWDSERGESGYTSDLGRKLLGERPGLHLAFIIGSDNLEHLRDWHDYTWLRENLIFIIIPRSGTSMPVDVLAEIRHTILEIPFYDVSSTQIRQKISQGQDIHGLVPEAVEERIRDLYKELA
ncbi:MAG TPA: nicotinate (nicotinamide) nucleotide adenylyltransferase [Candidatus Cloacimonadota bacterium]|jgi:nicotinate-nucleotide adenylyltransferase|nr:nicotinate (nicotinamide) nucleotide adenylyltransferase [Candidatus Cloacimonadota bacterium]